MTPWGENLTPENAWTEYPRPQLARDEWTNLNGLWDYAVSAANDDVPAKWDGKILVPFAIESALSGVGRLLQAEEQLWYRREFRLAEAPRRGRRLALHFGAVDYRTQVFVNGVEVTDAPHVGGNIPFSIDITGAVVAGVNELVVAVWDPTGKNGQALGKQDVEPHACFYTRVSGIWQTVWLEETAEVFIKNYRVGTDIDAGVATVSVELSGWTDSDVLVEVFDGAKRVAAKSAAPGETVALPIGKAKLWSPGKPFLYELRLRLADGSDSARGYFGMRKIEMREGSGGRPRLFFNNEELFQFGTLDQGWWPDGLLTPPSDDAMAADIQLLKDCGFNMMRKHIKIEPLRYYHLCDKLGILLWQDMPSGWGDSNARYAEYRAELAQMLDLLCNVPSIIAWVPYNESWGQPPAAKTNQTLRWVKRRDPSRLVDGPSGWDDFGVGDMKDAHNYPAPKLPPPDAPATGRASVLGEFGGIGLAVKDHLWMKPADPADGIGGATANGQTNWGYVSDDDAAASFARLKKLLADMRPLVRDGLAAAVYTQTTDVEIEINGLTTYDRKVIKYPVEKLRKLVTEFTGKKTRK